MSLYCGRYYHDKGEDPMTGNKLCKIRWFLDDIQDSFRRNQNLCLQVTVDELLVHLKGRFCPIRQYLPNKPMKQGMKVCCLGDVVSKYVYTFEVYIGVALMESLRSAGCREAKTGYDVVSNLMEDLISIHHIVFVDNFFTSLKLYADMARMGTFGCDTIQANCIGLPKCTTKTNSRAFRSIHKVPSYGKCLAQTSCHW